jgi:hypothetical protein
MLSSERQTAKEFWLVVKPLVREMESDDDVIIVDDSIEEKPYTDSSPPCIAMVLRYCPLALNWLPRPRRTSTRKRRKKSGAARPVRTHTAENCFKRQWTTTYRFGTHLPIFGLLRRKNIKFIKIES